MASYLQPSLHIICLSVSAAKAKRDRKQDAYHFRIPITHVIVGRVQACVVVEHACFQPCGTDCAKYKSSLKNKGTEPICY